MKSTKDFDAIVVGSGPNGLSAAIHLQQSGLSVLLLEAKNDIGGGLRTASLTLPGFLHDVCSAVHPLAMRSPFFKTLKLEQNGVEFIHSPIPLAHPLDAGEAAFLHPSLSETARALGEDEAAYLTFFQPIQKTWNDIESDLLGPIRFPTHPIDYALFGWKALPSALYQSARFSSPKARALWAGLAAHAIQPLSGWATSAVAIVLTMAAHTNGWPIVKGGSVNIALALRTIFLQAGGKIETNVLVKSLKDLPSSRAVLLDVTPRQLLTIAGHRFSSIYKWQLQRYQYGMGAYKIDWALDAPIPFTSAICSKSATVHLGNTLEEIAGSEDQTARGKIPEKPFVLLSQPSLFDATRAPAGKHTAWAYCHVPHGSDHNMTEAIENQVERFAPGFKERIIGRHSFNTHQMEEYNPNYIGGDINGGSMDISQLFTRPALRYSPYRTSAKGIYICSSSAPPGGGVHGMCGYHAAVRAIKDIFSKEVKHQVHS